MLAVESEGLSEERVECQKNGCATCTHTPPCINEPLPAEFLDSLQRPERASKGPKSKSIKKAIVESEGSDVEAKATRTIGFNTPKLSFKLKAAMWRHLLKNDLDVLAAQPAENVQDPVQAT